MGLRLVWSPSGSKGFGGYQYGKPRYGTAGCVPVQWGVARSGPVWFCMEWSGAHQIRKGLVGTVMARFGLVRCGQVVVPHGVGVDRMGTAWSLTGK